VASTPRSTAACSVIVRARLWNFPFIPPAAPTPTTMPETSSRERGKYGREMSGEFCRQIASFMLFEGVFYMPQVATWDRRLRPVRTRELAYQRPRPPKLLVRLVTG
jgi:hypothetical protein